MRIAATLEVSLIELIGQNSGTSFAPTEETLARLALVADVAAHLYVALCTRKEPPTGVQSVDLVSRILKIIEGNGLINGG